MTELLHALVSWPTLLLVLVVFGFAPGFCLRLIVRLYPRRDPRRNELIAELYTVPHIQRPLWVAEQLETVLFEGLPHRLAPVFRWFRHQRRVPIKLVVWVMFALGLVIVNWRQAGPVVALFAGVLGALIWGGVWTVLEGIFENAQGFIRDRRRRRARRPPRRK